MQKQILRIDEAAKYLKVSKRTVYRLIGSGHLEAFKVRSSLRIRHEALRAFIHNQIEEYAFNNGGPVEYPDSAPESDSASQESYL